MTSWHLIGVVVTAVIFYYIWPERDRDRANRPPGMNSSSTVFCSRWQYLRSINSLVVIVAFYGCAAHLATVKTVPAHLPTELRVDEPLESATNYRLAAEHEQPSAALGHDLLAAKISYGMLARRPKDESARSIYNFAVARVVQHVDRTDLEPCLITLICNA